MAMFCSNCGTEVREGAGFCPGCGTPVETRPGFQPPTVQQQQYPQQPPPEQPGYQPQPAPPPASQQQYPQQPPPPQGYPQQAAASYAAPKKGPSKKLLILIIIIAAAVVAALIIVPRITGANPDNPPDGDNEPADSQPAEPEEPAPAPPDEDEPEPDNTGVEGWPAADLPPGFPVYPNGVVTDVKGSLDDKGIGLWITISGTDEATCNAYKKSIEEWNAPGDFWTFITFEAPGSIDIQVGAEEQSFDFEKLAEEKNITLGDLPWHLLDIWWTGGDMPADFQRLDIDVTVAGNTSSDFFLYISPINTSINDRLLYAGMQTNISGWPSKTDQNIVTAGKGGIFSRWGKDMAEPIGLDYVDMFEDGLCESAGYEGSFCSVRRPFAWSTGAYTFSLVKEEVIDYNGSAHVWVAYEITEKNTSTTKRIGRLLFEGESLALRNSFAAFVEIYRTEKKAPEVTVTFGNPKVDGAEPAFAQIYAVPAPSSPNITSVSMGNEGIVVAVKPGELQPYPESGEYTPTYLK